MPGLCAQRMMPCHLLDFIKPRFFLVCAILESFLETRELAIQQNFDLCYVNLPVDNICTIEGERKKIRKDGIVVHPYTLVYGCEPSLFAFEEARTSFVR